MLTVFLSASYLCFNQYIVVLHPLCQELLYRLLDIVTVCNAFDLWHNSSHEFAHGALARRPVRFPVSAAVVSYDIQYLFCSQLFQAYNPCRTSISAL